MLNDLQCLHYSSIHIYRESLRVVEYYILNNGNGIDTARVCDIILIRFVYSNTSGYTYTLYLIPYNTLVY